MDRNFASTIERTGPKSPAARAVVRSAGWTGRYTASRVIPVTVLSFTICIAMRFIAAGSR
jgi:hypothetical protein